MKKFDKLALFGGKKIRNKPYKPPQMIDQKEKKAVMRVLELERAIWLSGISRKKIFWRKKSSRVRKNI